MARQSAAGPLSQREDGGRNGPGDLSAASVRGIVLLAVALLLGVFILNKTQAGTATPSSEPSTATTKAPRAAPTTTPPTTRAARQPAAIKVLAANGSGVAGLGSKTADKLTAAGYNSLAPDNTTTDVTTSVVEFTPGFDLEALFVANALGLQATAVAPLAADVPLEDTKGADIVVLVGPDLDTTAGGLTTPTTAFGVTTTAP